MRFNGQNVMICGPMTGQKNLVAVVGRQGSPFLQPGRSLELSGIGSCVGVGRLGFRVKSVSGSNVMWNCDQNWSAVRATNNRVYKQHSSLWTLEMDDLLKATQTDAASQFFLFPRGKGNGQNDTDYGDGGSPVGTKGVIDFTEGGETSRGFFARNVKSYGVTVAVYSPYQKVNYALDTNLLDVFLPIDESDGNGIVPVRLGGTSGRLKFALQGVPPSSVYTYSSAQVFSYTHTLQQKADVYVYAPVLWMGDYASMFGIDSYDNATELFVEVIYQAASTA